MTAYCWCTQYRGGGQPAVHKHGAQGPDGNCAHYVADLPADVAKDTEMREAMRGSFARASVGLVELALEDEHDLARRVTRRVGMRAAPVTVTVQCEHPDAKELLRQREALMRYVEELIEREDIPGLDRRFYHNRIQEMRHAFPGRSERETAPGVARESSASQGKEEGADA